MSRTRRPGACRWPAPRNSYRVASTRPSRGTWYSRDRVQREERSHADEDPLSSRLHPAGDPRRLCPPAGDPRAGLRAVEPAAALRGGRELVLPGGIGERARARPPGRPAPDRAVRGPDRERGRSLPGAGGPVRPQRHGQEHRPGARGRLQRGRRRRGLRQQRRSRCCGPGIGSPSRRPPIHSRCPAARSTCSARSSSWTRPTTARSRTARCRAETAPGPPRGNSARRAGITTRAAR